MKWSHLLTEEEEVVVEDKKSDEKHLMSVC